MRRISKSSVPCSSSMRSRSSLVDILGEDTALPVECQGEPAQDDYLETAHENGPEETVKAPGQLTRFGRWNCPQESGYLMSGNSTYDRCDRSDQGLFRYG